jgi:ATP-binding cassette subfamily C exporter for protease/lipase
MNPQSTHVSELREAFERLRPLFVRATLFSLITSLLILMPSIYMLEVYDRVVNSQSHTTLAMLTALVIGAFIVMEILDWARTTVMHQAGQMLDESLRERHLQSEFSGRPAKDSRRHATDHE